MSDAFRKVRPGEPLKVAADAWNRIVDQVVTKPRFSGEDAAFPATNFTVRIRNTSTGAVSKWGVLEIVGVLEAATGATGTLATGVAQDIFQSWPGLVGVVPTDNAGAAFAIAVEPIKEGDIGLAAVDGVVQCKLEIVDAGHRFATTKTGSASELKTASSGEASILWKQSGTGSGKWGLIRMGAGAGGGGGGVKVGKITGTWTKGGTQTVWEYNGAGSQVTGTSITGINRFATVSASGSAAKWVAVASVDSTWHLIAAECS
jgi:hypothetical protein